jgi:hypothetical protein
MAWGQERWPELQELARLCGSVETAAVEPEGAGEGGSEDKRDEVWASINEAHRKARDSYRALYENMEEATEALRGLVNACQHADWDYWYCRGAPEAMEPLERAKAVLKEVAPDEGGEVTDG